VTATEIRTLRAPARLRGHLDLFLNAGSLMATTLLTSLFGFAYWWVAARVAPAAAVGQASAAVSAMTLIGTIGMFGMGTMLISDLPALKDRKWDLISTCLIVAGAAATVGGVLYVIVAHLYLPGLRNSTPATVLLIAGIALNAVTLVLDEALVGLLQGPLQLMRNAWFSVIKLVLLGAAALLPFTLNGGELLLTWVAGIVLSTALLARTLRGRGLIDSRCCAGGAGPRSTTTCSTWRRTCPGRRCPWSSPRCSRPRPTRPSTPRSWCCRSWPWCRATWRSRCSR
jgi:O-antigen/teichoic acid export membrane protein